MVSAQVVELCLEFRLPSVEAALRFRRLALYLCVVRPPGDAEVGEGGREGQAECGWYSF